MDSRPVPARTPMTAEGVTVDHPKHRLCALTTFELRDYRRELEQAISLLDGSGAVPDPAPSARRDLKARLDDVLAEQAERIRLARA